MQVDDTEHGEGLATRKIVLINDLSSMNVCHHAKSASKARKAMELDPTQLKEVNRIAQHLDLPN